jgi:hypothetical protein
MTFQAYLFPAMEIIADDQKALVGPSVISNTEISDRRRS